MNIGNRARSLRGDNARQTLNPRCDDKIANENSLPTSLGQLGKIQRECKNWNLIGNLEENARWEMWQPCSSLRIRYLVLPMGY